MERFRRFTTNARARGTVQTVLVTLALLWLTTIAFREGRGVLTLAAVLVGLTAPYLLRALLVRNLSVLRWVFNLLLAAALLAAFLLDEHPVARERWFAPTVIGAMTFYISSYFWMLSDPFVTVDRP